MIMQDNKSARQADSHHFRSSELDIVCISRDSACARAPSIWFMGVFGTDDRLENWRVRLTMQLASLQSQRPTLSDITWPKHSTLLKHLLP